MNLSQYSQIFEKLQEIGQGRFAERLSRCWHSLNHTQREKLSAQILQLKGDLLLAQQKMIHENLSFGLSSSKSEKFIPQILGLNGQRPFTSQKSTRDASKLPEFEGEKPKTQVEEEGGEIESQILPFQETHFSGNSQDFEAGKELAASGKCACVVLAGGQGSRLRTTLPKGCLPVSVCKNKSLFELIADKMRAASTCVGHPLSLAMMTSPLNHQETRDFFIKNNFFGLHPDQITFFPQKTWPFLDLEGNLFLESTDQIASGPNGNGGVFQRLREIGLLEKWRRQGIETIHIVPVDNPLALPFDFELFGFHHRMGSQVSIKTAKRKNSHEKVGLLAQLNGKPAVIEYMELSLQQKEAKNPQGEYIFNNANLGLFCFSLSFLEEIQNASLPIHKAKKSLKKMDEEGKIHFPQEPNGWKFEEFIFDILPFAKKCHALIAPREECFAPLKNLHGEDSIEEVQAALLAWDRKKMHQISGVEPSSGPFELSSAFYYPTQELLQKWQGRALPSNISYINEEM